MRLHFAGGLECELSKSPLDCFDLDLILGEAMQAAKWPKRVTSVSAECNLPPCMLTSSLLENTIVPVNRIDVRRKKNVRLQLYAVKRMLFSKTIHTVAKSEFV